MKSLNENLFENLSVTELEERLEMTTIDAALAAGAVFTDDGGMIVRDHECSSFDCIQHKVPNSTVTEAQR